MFPIVASGIDDDAIVNLPLIHVSGYYHEWRWWQEQVDESTLSPVVSSMLGNHRRNRHPQDWVVDNSLIAYQLASQGLGVALGRSSLASGMLHNQQLKPLEREGLVSAPVGFYLAMSELGEQQPAAQLLFDFLTTEAS